MTTAAEFDLEIGKVPVTLRDATILNHDAARHVPSWLAVRPWREVRIVETIDGVPRELRIYVAPDFYSVGDDQSWRRVPMTPKSAQAIATRWRAILPSRKLARAIYQAADARIPMATFSPGADMTSPAKWREDDAVVASRLPDQRARLLAGQLVAGHRKDIVIGPGLDGSKVAIFGGARSAPDPKANPADPWAWQPYSTVHGADYADHSHGVRLILDRGYLDGVETPLADIFQHPTLHRLVSDQGPFRPTFPSSGTGGPTPVIYTPGTSSGGGSGPTPSPTPAPAPPVPVASGSSSSGSDVGMAITLLGLIVGVVNLLRR